MRGNKYPIDVFLSSQQLRKAVMTSDPCHGVHVSGVAAVLLMLLVLTPRAALADSGLFDVRTLCQPLEIHEGMPDEKACLKQLAGVAKRDDGRLALKLNSGKTKVISDAKECEDTTSEAACVAYRLVGYIGDRQFIVQVLPYECPYVLLVNRRSGAETVLGGGPHLSPNQKRFVVIDARDAGNCAPEYAVAVFSLTRDPPRLEWRFKPEGLEPYDFDTWNGENRVRLQATDANGKQVASDLTLTAQGWQLKRPNGELSMGSPAAVAGANSQTSPTQPAETAPGAPNNR
jgi:hypothetical protein